MQEEIVVERPKDLENFTDVIPDWEYLKRIKIKPRTELTSSKLYLECVITDIFTDYEWIQEQFKGKKIGTREIKKYDGGFISNLYTTKIEGSGIPYFELKFIEKKNREIISLYIEKYAADMEKSHELINIVSGYIARYKIFKKKKESKSDNS